MTQNPLAANLFNHQENSAVSRVGTAYTASTLSGQAVGAMHPTVTSHEFVRCSQGKSSRTTRSFVKTAGSTNAGVMPKLHRPKQEGNLAFEALARRAVQTGQRNRMTVQDKAVLMQREPPAWFKQHRSFVAQYNRNGKQQKRNFTQIMSAEGAQRLTGGAGRHPSLVEEGRLPAHAQHLALSASQQSNLINHLQRKVD